MSKLDKLTIKGFKSIRELNEFTLDAGMNVLIGANGAGKSNFVEFFRVLRAMVDQRLQKHIAQNGPADGFFHHGVGFTKQIEVDMFFGENRYAFTLEPTADGRIMIGEEKMQYLTRGKFRTIGTGVFESKLSDVRNEDFVRYGAAHPGVGFYVFYSLSSWQVYHFHDTSMTAGMRRDVGVDQCKQLNPDASNLAAFLFNWEKESPDSYRLLRKTIQRIAPYFDAFEFKESESGKERTVRLTWRQKGCDYVFQPGHLSDGTIRFICLATALLQPKPPTTIVFDEPEIGLHPHALGLLSGLMRSASSRMQLVASTQSPVLLSEFPPEQIVTVNHRNGQSEFQRLEAEPLKEWLAEYSTGDLWQKGVIEGGVNNE